jgi:ribosomal protein S12 methylthiotransferase
MYVTDELIAALAGSPKVIPYLDMPLQHISDTMLKRMNRKHDRKTTETIIARLRAGIPGLVLRTTFIVGFPGETDAEFDELLAYVNEARFERLGVFPYSFESDTPAARLPNQVASELRLERRDRVMEAQQKMAFAFNASLVGKEMDVLIDSQVAPGEFLGRTFADAPDVDGVVRVLGAGIEPGDLVACEITACDGYDLVAHAGRRPPSRRKPRPRPRKRPSSPFTILN